MSTSATDAEVHRLRRMETYFEKVINAVDVARKSDDPTAEIVSAALSAVKEYRTEGAGKWAATFAERVDVVFDGAPGADAPRFVEVEDMDRKSIKVGEWVERADGYWALRLRVVRP